MKYKKWFEILIREYFGGLRVRGIRPGAIAVAIGHFAVKHGVEAVNDQN